jgi:hypothetical protein
LSSSQPAKVRVGRQHVEVAEPVHGLVPPPHLGLRRRLDSRCAAPKLVAHHGGNAAHGALGLLDGDRQCFLPRRGAGFSQPVGF